MALYTNRSVIYMIYNLHTLHSPSRLDYSGIAFLIVGSFIPCLYYGFYCRKTTQIAYMVTVATLGTLCIIISLWDKFGTPKYRPLRAGKFSLKTFKVTCIQ